MRLAHRLVTRNSAGPLVMVSQAKPSGCRRAASSCWQPASSGVTEGRAISCSVSCRVRDMRAAGGSVFHVERDFGEGRLVVELLLLGLCLGGAAEVVLQAPHQVG